MSTFAFPGASSTTANGLNKTGEVVGSYLNPDGSQHGFVYIPSTGKFTTVDYPTGSTGTVLRDVNDAGHIAGYYFPAAGGVTNFVDVSGQFRAYTVIGQYGDYSEGIKSNSNATVGFTVGQGVYAWKRVSGTVSTFSVMGAQTAAYDMNTAGTVVGYYQQTYQRGFVQTAAGAQTTNLLFPGSDRTSAVGINDSNVVVGTYSAAARQSPVHGFEYVNGAYTALPDIAGSTSTSPSRINNAGTVVGGYVDGATGQTRSFVMTPQ